jgi:feruloyl esterase
MNANEAIAVFLIESMSIQTASNETRPLFKASFLVLLIGMLAGTTASFGQSTNQLSIDAVRQLRLPDVVLESVKSVGSDSKNPKAYLEVNGVIGTSIRFELLLPEDWNGRFVMGGGGGFVGTVQNMARGSVNRGYATVGTDTGHHDESGYLAGWAIDNLEAKVNFGHLAVHRTAEVAKALIRDYYGSDSKYSYFVGCSRGGGQAMMEAQRYPRDFDGIVAGAPAFNWTGLAAMSVAIAQALYPDPATLDHPVITKESLERLQASIIEQCDAQDGLKDGVVQNPPSTHFDLSMVPGITEEQRKAFEAIYRGAFNGNVQIYPGYSPGAECDPNQWIAWITGSVPPMVAKNHVPDLMFAFGTQIWKGLVFNDPDWDYSRYNFSSFERDTRLAASFLNATSPNLDAFKARKGKLIIWHGWADPALPPQATVDYYRQVEAHDPNAAEYCRLFMVPGCLHCGGGPGASEVDWLSTIADWVEHSQSPNKVIASKSESGNAQMTRPLFPYPRYAVYNGSGDTKSAESFVAKSPVGLTR